MRETIARPPEKSKHGARTNPTAPEPDWAAWTPEERDLALTLITIQMVNSRRHLHRPPQSIPRLPADQLIEFWDETDR